MDNTRDLLQIKIDTAKEKLSEATRLAIDSVGWKMVIAEMRKTRGYNFEQLGELETETELLLCGLLSSEDYSKELQTRMNLPRPEVEALINDMNQLVFSKIKSEFIKRTENKKTEVKPQMGNTVSEGINPVRDREGSQRPPISNGIKIITPNLITLEKKTEEEQKIKIKTILSQKLNGPVQTQNIQTDHSLKNLPTNSNTKTGDPYRELPE